MDIDIEDIIGAVVHEVRTEDAAYTNGPAG